MNNQFNSTKVLFWLYQAHYGMRLKISQGFKAEGYSVSPEQWSVLADLWQNGDSKQSLIAERTGRDAPAVTRLVKSLEKSEFVVRSAVDGRTNTVCLTQQGKSLHDLLQPIFSRIIETALCDFSEEEIEISTRIMKAIATN